MAKTKRGFIFGAFLVSCGATVLAVVAMATENWISATLAPNKSGVKGDGIVNYGLFFGTFKNNPMGSSYNTFRLTCECVTSENGCAFSSKDTKDAREQEINGILTGNDCKKITKILNVLDFVPDTSFEIFEENKEMYERSKPEKIINYQDRNRTRRNTINNYVYNNNNDTNDDLTKCDPTFLNMGLYITTLMFLSFAILIGTLTSIVTLRNVVGNPINPWFNIWGLYIWNCGASVIYLFVLILWGVQFDLYVKNNVGIIETLKGQYSNDEVALGFSYWILLIAIVLHGLSCALFYLRQYFIDKEPEIPDKPDNTDGMLFVY